MIEIKTNNPVYQKNLETLFKTVFSDPTPEAFVLLLPPADIESFFKKPADIPVLILGGTHPDSTAELTLPVSAAHLINTLRQMIEKNKNTPSFETPDFIFTGATRQLIHKKSNQTFRLTEKETALLVYLYQQSPHLVSKEELLTEVWSYHPQTETHTVETHIYGLRQKIGPAANALIQSSSEGYCLITSDL